jgi:hypothetical protein
MITINLEKAKLIAHDKRRVARTEEFAPLDEIIAKQIPGYKTAEIEAQRQIIREKYSTIQHQIDVAKTPDEIKAALGI